MIKNIICGRKKGKAMVKNMKKILGHQVPFPVGAESDNFTAALASALVIARGYTVETPYWCTSKRRHCIHCSPCGDHRETVP